MKRAETLGKYCGFTGEKSGFVFDGGKLVYLYNDICCEAICRRVLLRSDGGEFFSEYVGGLTVTRCGTRLEASVNSKRLFRVSECVILYEIALAENSLYGAFTGGKEFLLADSHFTDERVLLLIDRLLIGRYSVANAPTQNLAELEEAVRTGEIRALNEMYLKYENAP